MFGSKPAETTSQAREILVNFRIPHHAVIVDWWGTIVMVIMIFVIIALCLVRRTKLFKILLTCFLVAMLKALLQLITQSDELALLFPWRISAILVPLSTSIMAAHLVSAIVNRIVPLSTMLQNGIVFARVVSIAFLILIGASRFKLDLTRKATAVDGAVMFYVNKARKNGDIYLIPI